MLRDHERIAREMADPALVRLHRKLERLTSVLTVMNTGAHPDDEHNGMLAAFRFGFGMRVTILCSTRGEGGQNAIGPERGAALGIVRTRELEAAAQVLDADVIWVGHGPDDPIHDFGFSKNGDDTLRRWGEDFLIERLVRAFREERPDIVIPTFLDVPGQHGHHRAMTRSAKIAVERASDPSAYPDHFTEGLKPWRVAKFYLPAWSGGGITYDDEVPPPETTVVVRTPGSDAATGAPFARIGEWSRAKHLTQGMGVWRENPLQSWPLHLGQNQNSESDIRDGLPSTVGAVASYPDVPREVASHLLAAQQAIDEATAAFPHRERIVKAALASARSIESALAASSHPVLDSHGHRLTRKLRELDAVILEASGVHARAWVEPAVVPPGGRTALHIALDGSGESVSVSPLSRSNVSVASRTRQQTHWFDLDIATDTALTNLFPPHYRAAGGNGDLAVVLEAEIGGRKVQSTVDLEEPLRIAPDHSVALDPETILVNLQTAPQPFTVKATLRASEGNVALKAPEGWQVASNDKGLLVTPPASLTPGLHRVEAWADGAPAYRSTEIAYPHIGRTAHLTREVLNVLALDVARHPDTRIGYVGGGNDKVGLWLSRLGFDVTDLDGDALQNDLSRFTTIVVGIFAFGTRPDLAAATHNLHRFVETGGHLVTLYHRPTDGWDPARTPPRPIRIGSPSLRWRVTDPHAPVRVLAPTHPLLLGPNRIGDEDWADWDKERGLYFASAWDDSYTPLLAMNDAGEKPLEGALISGAIDRGRHTHVSLVLHHQLDKLVPGAFRLLTNLVQPT
ncbi:PIG-L family deacetylase [Microvirga terricola]|uniref:PIG-L family deacetylase n=1 Tax=Microvirga terricola TaxID=2719797 RepID=A0ABX0V7I5_9HYPH|nr:PIG-L family deacetylase [Microvirga terricola]NIX75035.1 PIG-L family deacetylase [Microvirga terricola]